MEDWFLGTMGFSYDDWRGVFYPAEMPSRNFLNHYSRLFNAVEIDSTFYGTPRAEIVQRWNAITPDPFMVCVKTPRLITHEFGLAGARGQMGEFLDVMRLLGEQLGPVLIQFPPSFASDQFSLLTDFLAGLPGDLRFAVEFRHQSWYTPQGDPPEGEVVQLLEKLGICWAATQYPGVPVRIHRTADFLYIRWIGQHGSFQEHDRVRIDRTADLLAWWQIIQPHLDNIKAVYGFFNNDYAGHAPATCNLFKSIAGLPTENLRPPQQPALF